MSTVPNLKFSSVSQLLFEYNAISTPTQWSYGIRWHFIEQQTTAAVHLQIWPRHQHQLGADYCKHVDSIQWRYFQHWIFTIWSNSQRRQNWSWSIYRSAYQAKTSFDKYICNVSISNSSYKLQSFLYGTLGLKLNFEFRPTVCRIYSGDNELFPLHSFGDDGLCYDDRLEVQVSDLSQQIQFKYRTFRFQQINTIDQRHQIHCKLKLATEDGFLIAILNFFYWLSHSVIVHLKTILTWKQN